jgi:hypothetical protein
MPQDVRVLLIPGLWDYFAAVTGGAVLAGFVLCVWLYEAFFQPLFSTLDAIG